MRHCTRVELPTSCGGSRCRTAPRAAASTGGTEAAHAHAGVHSFVIPGTVPTSALWAVLTRNRPAPGGDSPGAAKLKRSPAGAFQQLGAKKSAANGL